MATQSSILAWKISWTEEPGGMQSIGSQRVRHDWTTNTHLHLQYQTSPRTQQGHRTLLSPVLQVSLRAAVAHFQGSPSLHPSPHHCRERKRSTPSLLWEQGQNQNWAVLTQFRWGLGHCSGHAVGRGSHMATSDPEGEHTSPSRDRPGEGGSWTDDGLPRGWKPQPPQGKVTVAPPMRLQVPLFKDSSLRYRTSGDEFAVTLTRPSYSSWRTMSNATASQTC